MKNLIHFLKGKAVLLSLAIAACCVSFSSCSDDDDPAPVVDTIGKDAPYCGVWQVTYMKTVEDGEVFEGAMPAGNIVKMTLKENGTFEYYVYSPDEEYTEEYKETGKWTFSGNKIYCKVENDMNGVTQIMGEILVMGWNEVQLVTKHDFGAEGYEVRTWQKI